MADQIWKVDIAKSLGGASLEDSWKNTHYFALDSTIDSTEVEDVVNWLVSTEKEAHYDVVRFLQAHVVQVAKNSVNRPKHDFRTIGLTGTGERNTNNVLFPDAKVLPLENVLVIQRSPKKGRNGTLALRGCLLDTEVIIGANNKYVFSPGWLEDFSLSGVSNMIGNFNGTEGLLKNIPHGAIMCLPDKVDSIMEQFATGFREIESHTVKGVSTRQRTVQRIPSDSRLAYAANGRLHDLAQRLRDINTNGFLQTVLGIAEAAKIGLEAKEVWEAVPSNKKKLVKLPPSLKALPALAAIN